MPTYAYYCPKNAETLEVMHGITRTVETWGELCAIADRDTGDTPADTPVDKLLGTGMVLADKPEPGAPPAGGGCCGGMCQGHH
ncbi:MAG: zinc ribbon domain-containing protein [Planctomycetota bacterium]